MRHLRSGRKLKRTRSHRKATLAALSTSLVLHKKIRTTVAKAKEARMVVENLITQAKNAVAKETTSEKKEIFARRKIFAFLRSKAAVSMLFKEVAPKVTNRPGGYTRVVKLGRRHGDGAELAILELVDFNVGQDKSAPKVTKKTGKQKKGAKTKKSTITETLPETTGKKLTYNEVETGTDSPPISESSGNVTEKG